MLASSRVAYHRPEQVGCLGFLRWTVQALAEDIGTMDAGAGACTGTESFVVEVVGWVRVRLQGTYVGFDHQHSWDSDEQAKVQKNSHMLIGHYGCAETH
jgi:hypothetical protein